MKKNLFDRQTWLVTAAILMALLLFVLPSLERVASAQSGSGESNANANKSTSKKTPAKQPVAKKPTTKKSPTGNSSNSNRANAAADERTYWESIRNSTDTADFRAYLKEYPNGKYVTLATNRLNSLAAAANSSRTNTTSSPPANTTSAGKQVRNGKSIEMVWIPPGSFDMGSNNGDADEKPVHRVTIGQGFFMGKYEVTQGQWQAVTGANPSNFKGDDNLPVEQVSWEDAQDFINKLNDMNDGYKYSLPTEAEWEYACRAGTTGDYYVQNVDDIGWYSGNSANTAHRVGSKQANAFGLYDMSGNVWEWCRDWYTSDYTGAPTDGSARLSGSEQTYRIMRSGSWGYGATLLRSAHRSHSSSGSHINGYGGVRIIAVGRTQ